MYKSEVVGYSLKAKTMAKKNIKGFEDKKIRTEWDSEKEDWWFSVHDVVQVLSDCKDVRDYIKKMKYPSTYITNAFLISWGHFGQFS